MTEEQIVALPDYASSNAFTPLQQLVLDYATAMTGTPVDVPDELVAALRERFDDAQLVELTYAIGWENWRARVDHAFGIESAGFSEGAACTLPHRADGQRSTTAANRASVSS